MEHKAHVCPPWVGKLMVSPLRKLGQNPDKLLKEFIKPGFKIIEIGPGMGFFSLPMAKLVGESGMIYCVDIQQDMLTALDKRAVKAGVNKQITTQPGAVNTLNISDLEKQIDFGLLFAVVHEIPDQELLFKELAHVLKSNAKILFAEPKGHVKPMEWNKSLKLAENAGFKISEAQNIRGSLSALLTKI